MAIFNSYVSLPEGNTSTLKIVAGNYNLPSPFQARVVMLIWRATIMGFKSDLAKDKWGAYKVY